MESTSDSRTKCTSDLLVAETGKTGMSSRMPSAVLISRGCIHPGKIIFVSRDHIGDPAFYGHIDEVFCAREGIGFCCINDKDNSYCVSEVGGEEGIKPYVSRRPVQGYVEVFPTQPPEIHGNSGRLSLRTAAIN